jgi:uncharacterized RDD family membrane protein YckC
VTQPGQSPPATGAGAPAGFGRRLLAFAIDALLSVGIAVITGHRPGTGGYGLVVFLAFLVIEFSFVSLAGQTPGMRVAQIVVVRAVDRSRPPVQWVAVRTLLLATVVPALVVDGSGRALHDRASGTSMLRLR